jgi:hypothetical protein
MPLMFTGAICAQLVAGAPGKTSREAPEATIGSGPVVWRFEDVRGAGRPSTTVLGEPRAVTEDGRKALRFNGQSDGLIFAQNPLAGWKEFTVEVLFKPDGDGPAEQRFVHMEDRSQNRALIETRVTAGGHWYLDTYLHVGSADQGLTLVDKEKRHPADRWYWAALVFDGRTMSHFLDGTKEKEGRIAFGPMGEGRTSVGVRLNQVFWFKGCIAEVRFHPRALGPGDLQRLATRPQ